MPSRNTFGNAGPVESLESRRLMSAGATLFNGVLAVRGIGTQENAIVVRNSADLLTVDVSVVSTNALGTATTFTKSFPRGLVGAVWIRGGARADVITIDESADEFALPVRVDSRSGDDTVRTGSGNDIVFSGAGKDDVDTRGGDDWIRGMLGDDTLKGSGGNDRINAGPGNDQVDAGGGNDLVRGEAGNDTLDAGRGDDRVYAGLGDDTLFGGDGDDHLWGAFGNDVIFGGDGNDTLGGILGTNALRGEAGIDTFLVRDLALNPTNDYDAAVDVLTTVPARTEGGTPPAM